jgi:hypothetical protein
MPFAALLGGTAPASAQVPFEWEPGLVTPGAVDIAGPWIDGRFVVSGDRRPLRLYRPGGKAERFAGGKHGHVPKAGTIEPYIALPPGDQGKGAGCSFKRSHIFMLKSHGDPSVIRINRRGVARKFADLPAGSFLSAITFDQVGGFGGRLLVAARFGVPGEDATVDLYGIDCRGEAEVIADDVPEIEGGMVVAPPSFEPYGGRLIAADEIDGILFAFSPDGTFEAIASVPAPVGRDLGIENAAFVPQGFGAGDAAYMADRSFPGPVDGGAVHVASAEELAAAGVGPGDLISATEGGMETFRYSCGATGCTAVQVGTGLDIAHGEGHIAFGPAP